jgi:hypothetical protein
MMKAKIDTAVTHARKDGETIHNWVEGILAPVDKKNHELLTETQ